jgi:DNA-binding HxlR family transcriptional regulator
MKNEPRYAPKIDWLQDQCPIKATVDVTGGRWKPLILFYLLDQPKRFSALRKDIPSVTAQMLTLQLRQLEADGIVARLSMPKFRFVSSTRSRPTAERFRAYCVVCGNGVNNISTGGTKKRAKEAEPLKPQMDADNRR